MLLLNAAVKLLREKTSIVYLICVFVMLLVICLYFLLIVLNNYVYWSFGRFNVPFGNIW